MPRLPKFLAVLFAVILPACISSCSVEYKMPPVYTDKEPKIKVENKDEYIEKGKQAVENFHNLFNQGKYNEMFQLIDDSSELKQDPVYFDLRMHKINRELGKFEEAKFTRASVFQKKNTYEVRLEFISKFNKESGKAPRYELFFWEIYDTGDLKLLNYTNGIDNESGY